MAEEALLLFCSAMPGAVQEGSECWGTTEQAQRAVPLLFSGPTCPGGTIPPGVALPTKVRIVKAMVFPVIMYGCESWTIKKAEH